MPRPSRKPMLAIAKPPAHRIVVVRKPFGYGVTKLFFVVGDQTFASEAAARAHVQKLRNPGAAAKKAAKAAVAPTPGTVWALVVRSPFAQEIASGEKGIEYRSRRARYRGWVAIVAARRPESGDDAGRVVCLVKLVDCTGGHREFEWHLADPIPLQERWEVPGRLGLFNVTEQVPGWVRKLIGE